VLTYHFIFFRPTSARYFFSGERVFCPICFSYSVATAFSSVWLGFINSVLQSSCLFLIKRKKLLVQNFLDCKIYLLNHVNRDYKFFFLLRVFTTKKNA